MVRPTVLAASCWIVSFSSGLGTVPAPIHFVLMSIVKVSSSTSHSIFIAGLFVLARFGFVGHRLCFGGRVVRLLLVGCGFLLDRVEVKKGLCPGG